MSWRDGFPFHGTCSTVFPCNILMISYVMISQCWYSIGFVALEIYESIQTHLNIYLYFPSIVRVELRISNYSMS